LKEGKVELLAYEEDAVNEIIFSLATHTEFYAMMRLAIHLTENEPGDKLYDETVKKYLKDDTSS